MTLLQAAPYSGGGQGGIPIHVHGGDNASKGSSPVIPMANDSEVFYAGSGFADTGEPKSAGKLLIVDDDYSIRRALHMTLYAQGFDVTEASSGDEALSLARAVRFDAVLLDINMPGRDGVEVCRELRRLFPRLAILMLTVRSGQDDQVGALDAGADDYVTKPFQMRELTARIRAAVRRVQTPVGENERRIRIGQIVLDPARRYVEKSGQIVLLTPKEFDLLYYLMSHPGVPVNHSRLLTSVWGSEYSSRNEYLRTFIRQLRKKLEDDPTDPKYLLTDSHIGYRFTDAASLEKASQESQTADHDV
jgi:two-component system KDP operon response regulator KdpE